VENEVERIDHIPLPKQHCPVFDVHPLALFDDVLEMLQGDARDERPARGGSHVDRKVDVRLPGKGDSNPHGARPVHLIITMIKWSRTSRLSIKNSLSLSLSARGGSHVGTPGEDTGSGWASVQRKCRGTSLIRNSTPIGPYSKTRPRALWWS